MPPGAIMRVGRPAKRVWVAAHRGMVGSALLRRLASEGCELLTAGRDRDDLRRQADAEAWMAEARPQAVFLAAATVGGILAKDARPDDNFDLKSSHVLPALLRKAREAKRRGDRDLKIWGAGALRREFLHADGLVHLMRVYSDEPHVNLGSGVDATITELARLAMAAVGLDGALRHDLSKPDGTPRKLMSGARMAALGWRPRIALEEGVRDVYAWARDRVFDRRPGLRPRPAA